MAIHRRTPRERRYEARGSYIDALSLLRTCCQIQQEATALAYANCTFDIANDMVRTRPTAAQRAMITRLTVGLGWVKSAHSKFVETPGLRYIDFPALERIVVLGYHQALNFRRPVNTRALRQFHGRSDLEIVFRDSNGDEVQWEADRRGDKSLSDEEWVEYLDVLRRWGYVSTT